MQNKPPHLTIDKAYNTVLISEPINELDDDYSVYTTKNLNTMNDKLNTQSAFLSAVRSAYFIVGSVDASGSLSFAANPAKHENSSLARLECKRLAAAYPGKAYIFVKFAGAELVPNQYISI
jgi:hypothetical protein